MELSAEMSDHLNLLVAGEVDWEKYTVRLGSEGESWAGYHRARQSEAADVQHPDCTSVKVHVIPTEIRRDLSAKLVRIWLKYDDFENEAGIILATIVPWRKCPQLTANFSVIAEQTAATKVTQDIADIAEALVRDKRVVGEYETHHNKKGQGVVVRYEDHVYNIRLGNQERLLCVQDVGNPDVLWAFGYYDGSLKRTCDCTITHFQHRWFSI
jgi:hypothetical protein